MIRKSWWSIGLWCWMTAISAASIQSLDEIRKAVATELASRIRQDHQNYDISVAPLDPRLRLPYCDQPLHVALPHRRLQAGWLSVQVRCGGSHPWVIYVKAKVRIYRQVAVLTQDLAKGTLLQPGHLALRQRDLGDLRRGYFTALDEVVGRRLRRSLPQGYALNPQALTDNKIVHRGEAVVIRARIGALDVRMGGHALMDGSQGQRIRVRNDRSKRVVEGIVRKPGEVWVTF
ncbi:MAG TPA: flagellar basal body P-ring formation protein FlgA [Methylothermaceae bacterium]|nr:flagellar basal body P-ring formation protein FlgA [Methylothermaceae bacterium]